MSRKSMLMSILLSVTIALSALCGCSWMGAPATTEELLIRYVANENVSNFNMKADANLSVTALGVHAKIPIHADFDATTNAAHGTITVDLSTLDTRDYAMEVYAEQRDQSIICYLSSLKEDGTPTTWKCWTIDMTSSIDVSTLAELLQSSELTVLAKDSDEKVRYELTVPSETVLNTTFKLLKNSVEVAGMDEQAFIDAMGTDKYRVDFTEDCLIRSIATGASLNLKSAETNNVPVKIAMDVNAVFDDYGTKDASQTTVPDDVRENATPTDVPVDIIEVIGADSPLAGAVAH